MAFPYVPVAAFALGALVLQYMGFNIAKGINQDKENSSEISNHAKEINKLFFSVVIGAITSACFYGCFPYLASYMTVTAGIISMTALYIVMGITIQERDSI